jgi:hypothetical protein
VDERAHRVQRGETLGREHVAGEREAGRHAHHAHARGERQGQHGACGLQRRLRERVAQEVGVLVPELLVQQVDHCALRIGLAASGDVRMQRLRQQHGRACVAAQVPLEQRVAEAGRRVVLEQRGAVDHGIHAAEALRHARQQGAHGCLVLKIRTKMGAIARQLRASSYCFNSFLL